MKFKDFQLPRKIEWLNATDNYAKMFCEPFEKGYGHTIGNSLRRVILASLEGAVITSVKIKGASHEYSSIKGVKEDVLEIIFNLKQLRFKIDSEEKQKIILETNGITEITGKEFKLNEGMKILNPEVHIATLSEGIKLSIETTVERGRGYRFASERQDKIAIGEIPIDAAFTPVKKVKYIVENVRVGQATDYDRLVFEVWTDGSVKPKEAVAYASQVLSETLKIFELPDIEEIEFSKGLAVEIKKEEEIKDEPIEILKISVRIKNILKKENINTIGDLLKKSIVDIQEIEKMGAKSVDEIKLMLDRINKERGANLELKS